MTPRSPLDRWLRPELVRFASAVFLAMVGCAAVAIFATDRRGGMVLGLTLGADYAQFFAVGVIQNEYGVGRIYDLALQDRVLHRVVPGFPADAALPYVYPPFLAPVFRPLARLPYSRSFMAWLAVTAALYAASVALMLRHCPSIPGRDRGTAWLVALSFEPFAVECWLGGQLSAVGCLAVAAGLACHRGGRPFSTGLAFSLLSYKPTLLVLLLPMLVVGRCWRVLTGFATGAAALAALSLAVAGPGGCLDFGRLMAGYARRGGSIATGFRNIKYVDVTAFIRLLGFGDAVARPLAVALALPPLAALAAAWWRLGRRPAPDLDPALAVTLCWTPVLNLYGPIYDAVLAVPGLLLGADWLRRRGQAGWPSGFTSLLAVLYATAWVSPLLAVGLGFQTLTIGLLAIGTYLLGAASDPEPPDPSVS